MSKILISNVPYLSQTDNPHTGGKYWATDPDRRDSTPDGCWMNELPNGGHFGREAEGCPGPKEKGCIRPGSCNVTSLAMLAAYFGLSAKPEAHPDGKPLSAFLRDQPLSPTWIYVYMMDFWGKGEQIWDGRHPTTARNSMITARGAYLQVVLRLLCGINGGKVTPKLTIGGGYGEYRQALEAGSPVVIASGKMRHVILGIGAFEREGTPWIIAHDPYGRKSANLSRWEAYNGCGDRARCGEGVEYPFDLLQAQYLLYCGR
ncbi:MAG: hypothetical protein NTW14_14845 [bacterium]|nr:hypothetical protein [bacterium]